MSGKRILIYYPPNNRSVAIETLCITLKEAGNEVIVLTLTPKGPFHAVMEGKGIRTEAQVLERKQGWKYFIAQSRNLRRFCKENKVDVVWSHLQEGNIIAVLAQPFMKARLITFRHHAESAFYAEFGAGFNMKRNNKEVLLDKIINRLSKLIVVPSSGVWYGMEKYEKCRMSKVRLIPYIYDFSSYPPPDNEKVKTLRATWPARLMLIMVSRMIATKQHMPVFKVVNKLIKEGVDVKMIVMDDGALKSELEKFIADNGLKDHIILVGYRQDFVNYMAASDLLMHPSLTEASNNVVKEMGLLEKGVAVCRNVGDFNDYIREKENGYFLDSDNLEATIESAIRHAYQEPERLKQMGKELKNDVLRTFSNTLENRSRYLELLN